MNGKLQSPKRGAMLLMLFVLLIVGSIVALRLMPNEELITRRDKETGLNSDLSQIREALDLIRVSSNPDWIDLVASDTSDKISAKIASLTAFGYLRSENIKDSTVSKHLWGSGSGKKYWVVTENLASNTSFEDGQWVIAADKLSTDSAWEKAADSTVSTDTINYLNTTKLDEYPYQNKFGNLLSKDGRAIRITR